MFGLVVWGGFLLWIYITFLAIRCGRNLGKDKGFEKLGAFCGFMLTMGVFIVYWIVEFVYIQAKVSHLCETEGGVTVYITPEEYKVRLKSNNFDGLPKVEYVGNGFLFDGFEYDPDKYDDRFGLLSRLEYFDDFFISRDIFFDKKTQVVLVREYGVYAFEPSLHNNLSGLKFWKGSIKDCTFRERTVSVSDLYNDFEGVIQ